MKKNSFQSSVGLGARVACKYPKHGTRNVLKRHEGVVDKVGNGPAGWYLTVRHDDGTIRSLSLDRMIDPKVVS